MARRAKAPAWMRRAERQQAKEARYGRPTRASYHPGYYENIDAFERGELDQDDIDRINADAWFDYERETRAEDDHV
jgi:hypothetical protein